MTPAEYEKASIEEYSKLTCAELVVKLIIRVIHNGESLSAPEMLSLLALCKDFKAGDKNNG